MPEIYIEFRIVSSFKRNFRHKYKQKLPCPDTLEDLGTLFKAQDPQPTCNCDQCNPRLYESYRNCKLHRHCHPKLKFNGTQNEFGNQCYKPMKMNLAKRSEAMELTRTAVRYFDLPLENLNNTQLSALRSLQTWIRDHMSLLFPDTWYEPPASLEGVLSASSMRELWAHINVLFFGSDVSRRRSEFHWSARPHRKHEDTIGSASERKGITMTPTVHCLEMLGTLLQQVCHMFLLQNACFNCRSSIWNVDTDGHGRAWQVLAAAVERRFTDFTGLSTELGRFNSIQDH